jgi:NTP pyrophosphatase (non-canonical NTP hydrolase)
MTLVHNGKAYRLANSNDIGRDVLLGDGTFAIACEEQTWNNLREYDPTQPMPYRSCQRWKYAWVECGDVGTSEDVLNDLCVSIHAKQKTTGWWDAADNNLVVPTKLALIHSEVSEALHGHRQNLKDDKLTHRSMLAVELADVFIRVADLAGFLGIPLGTIVAEKEAYNAQRADHKPENRAKKGGKLY